MKLGPRTEAISKARSRIYTADSTVESAQAQFNLLAWNTTIADLLDSLSCHLGQTLSPGTSVGEIVERTRTHGRCLASSTSVLASKLARPLK